MTNDSPATPEHTASAPADGEQISEIGQTAEDSASADEAAAEAAAPAEDIEALKAELAEAKDQALRALAELQNGQRRAERQIQDARTYAIEKFAADLLGVADNLARATGAVPADAREQEPFKTLVVGVEMTERAMLDVFAKHGLRQVGAAGEPFDPNRHQAVAQIPSAAPAGAVAEVLQPGYVLNERTVRAALVAVSLGGGAGGGSPESPSGGTGNGPNEPGETIDIKA